MFEARWIEWSLQFPLIGFVGPALWKRSATMLNRGTFSTPARAARGDSLLTTDANPSLFCKTVSAD
jgi:hypothetical protein